jgi:hypothetical protein
MQSVFERRRTRVIRSVLTCSATFTGAPQRTREVYTAERERERERKRRNNQGRDMRVTGRQLMGGRW